MSKIEGIVFDLDDIFIDSVDMWSEMWASAKTRLKKQKSNQKVKIIKRE